MFRYNIDTPQKKLIQRISGHVHVTGWWFDDATGKPADRIFVRIGKRVVECERVARMDVISAFPETFDSNKKNVQTLPSKNLPATFPSVGFKTCFRMGNGMKYIRICAESEGQTTEMGTFLLYFNKKEEPQPATDYQRWIEKYDTLTNADIERMKAEIETFPQKPLISVVMPVYNTPERYLREAIESVIAQIYPHWELCIADDASPKPYIKTILAEYEKKDSRIKVVYRKTNGHISEASNSALEIATGEWVALLDHDDVLPQHALFCVIHEINKHKEKIDLLYSDEDKIDEDDKRYDPYFKNDWNSELILEQNYVAHLGIYRTSIAKNINGFKKGYEGSQDYDFLLRFIEHTKSDRIIHIPRILYHWRNFKLHTSFSVNNHSISDKSAEKALRDYIERNDIYNCSLNKNETFPGSWRVLYKLKGKEPLVSIIIPMRDKIELLKSCLIGLLNNTNYSNIEIIIIDNGSSERETINYLKSIQNIPNLNIIRNDEPFNFSRLNNIAAKQASGDILCFLNNDIDVSESTWLYEMVSRIQRKDVGAVGAKLFYESGNIQHAGVTLGIYGVACHPYRHFPKQSTGFFGHLQLARNVSAVTAACMIVKKDIFTKVGGFDEDIFAVGFNDVDLSLKIRNAGYSIIFTPYAKLIHKESASRGMDLTKEQKERHENECRSMISRYGKQLKQDPFYNPNLSIDDEHLSIAELPRTRKPWFDWIEFICPFQRGDVLIAIQVAFHAWTHGIKLRLHVAESLKSLVDAFTPPFPVMGIPIPMPKSEEVSLTIERCVAYVQNLPDFSGEIALSHKKRDFKSYGLNIVEHFLNELNLSIESIIKNVEPAPLSNNALIPWNHKKKVLLLHPVGGWELKCLPKHILELYIREAHNSGYYIVQIGGKNDTKVENADHYILENYSIQEWSVIFKASNLVVCVDSWSSHFCAILDIPHIVCYGSTSSKFTNSRKHFSKQSADVLLLDTSVNCSPCDSFKCKKYDLDYCKGYEGNDTKYTNFINKF